MGGAYLILVSDGSNFSFVSPIKPCASSNMCRGAVSMRSVSNFSSWRQMKFCITHKCISGRRKSMYGIGLVKLTTLLYQLFVERRCVPQGSGVREPSRLCI